MLGFRAAVSTPVRRSQPWESAANGLEVSLVFRRRPTRDANYRQNALEGCRRLKLLTDAQRPFRRKLLVVISRPVQHNGAAHVTHRQQARAGGRGAGRSLRVNNAPGSAHVGINRSQTNGQNPLCHQKLSEHLRAAARFCTLVVAPGRMIGSDQFVNFHVSLPGRCDWLSC